MYFIPRETGNEFDESRPGEGGTRAIPGLSKEMDGHTV